MSKQVSRVKEITPPNTRQFTITLNLEEARLLRDLLAETFDGFYDIYQGLSDTLGEGGPYDSDALRRLVGDSVMEVWGR